VSHLRSRRPWARPLLRVLPMETWLELEHELRLLWLNVAQSVSPRQRLRRRRWRGRSGFKANLGCGAHTIPGWVNVDAIRGAGIDLRQDLRRALPFDTASCRLIFAHHLLEHFRYPDQALSFLRECRRVAAPDACLRIVVPDLEVYVGRYRGERDRPPLQELIGPTEPLNLRGEQFHLGLWRGGSHKFAYDEETLRGLLQLAGFQTVERVSFGQSGCDAEIVQDRTESWFHKESLYMEGRPGGRPAL
jgi:predicted SAM-dependent methyltransferase